MSEPEHISTIAGRVLADIERQREKHRHGVMAAVSHFLAGKSKRPQRGIRKGKAETSLFSRTE